MMKTLARKCKYQPVPNQDPPLTCDCLCVLSKKGSTVHKLIAANKSVKALGSDRRDDMRYNLRAKMSNKDYLDRDMQKFHYANSTQQKGQSNQNTGAAYHPGNQEEVNPVH